MAVHNSLSKRFSISLIVEMSLSTSSSHTMYLGYATQARITPFYFLWINDIRYKVEHFQQLLFGDGHSHWVCGVPHGLHSCEHRVLVVQDYFDVPMISYGFVNDLQSYVRILDTTYHF